MGCWRVCYYHYAITHHHADSADAEFNIMSEPLPMLFMDKGMYMQRKDACS